MNIIGTMYLVDEKHIDVAKQAMATNPPPMGALSKGSVLCMDMDETTNELEMQFPDHTAKATILCPPPCIILKELDGDAEGFIEGYNAYLDNDESVQEIIASILMFLHMGGNVLLYSPAFIDDDVVWLNTLMLYFFTRYGISIGTPTSNFSYDPRYDEVIASTLYKAGYIDVFGYINCSPEQIPGMDVQEKVYMDLLPVCGPGEVPMDIYMQVKNSLLMYGKPVIKPAITFG